MTLSEKVVCCDSYPAQYFFDTRELCSILFILAIPPICNTKMTTTITTTTTTETILPCCAGTCNGVASYYPNTTSCGLTCLDPGGFRCLSGSTYCAGGSFDLNGYCNAANGDPPCPTGYCCVFNTYYSSAPYACMKCTTPSKRHCQKKWFVVIRIRRSTSLIRENCVQYCLF